MSKRQRLMKERTQGKTKRVAAASASTSSSTSKKDKFKSSSDMKKSRGENFYVDKVKLARRKMLNSGKAERNQDGKIVKPAAFANYKPDSPIVRIAPNRKWFGNTRTLSSEHLEKFKLDMATKMANPYQVLLRQNKLPMILLEESKKFTNNHLLQVESFESTFGRNASRIRPKLVVNSLEEMAESVQSIQDKFDEKSKDAAMVEANLDVLLRDAPADVQQEYVFKKGQSKRIWNELYKVIDSSDVVVHVLDARNPLGTLCKRVETFLEKEAKHKHLVYLLNKCDLIPHKVTEAWVKYLSKSHPCLAFHASLQNPFGKGALITLLRQFSKLHPERKQISVGFIGYPNTGKSSIINALRKKKVCTVAPIPGQTKVWQYVTLMKKIYLIDCPGIVPHDHEDSEQELVLKGAIRVENIMYPEDSIPLVLQRVKPEYLEKVYGVSTWQNPLDFMAQVAKKSGKLLKGGEPDIPTVAKMILNDWLRGELPYFTPLPKEDEKSTELDSPS